MLSDQNVTSLKSEGERSASPQAGVSNGFSCMNVFLIFTELYHSLLLHQTTWNMPL